MTSYKPLLLLMLLLCMMGAAQAQVNDTAAAEINPQVDNNQVKFDASLRPLRQIAGAPASFYSYFWEFGDGSYSFEKNPVHIYKDTGDYDVRLYATNNYDDGKKPNTRPRRVRVNNRSMLAENKKPVFFTGEGSLEIKSNQMPKPGEDMVLLIGYRNKSNTAAPISGSVMLLYNEKQFNQNCFDISETRSYHQEKTISLESMMAWLPNSDLIEEQAINSKGIFTVAAGTNTPTADRRQMMQQIKQEMNSFRKHTIWRINNVEKGEEQFMFLTINTLPEMISDTNAVVTISGLFVPDDPSMDMEKFNLEMQVVASHDPNRMMLKNKKLNYRFTGKNRENAYKVQFQNTGKGPAKRVAITVTIPGLLNTASLEVVGMKPECPWCNTTSGTQSCIDTVVTKDSIQFIFNNIYLPGTQQDGVNDPDSTKGYIKYRIRFSKKMHKVPFQSRAAIVFDKNEPIYTNRSTGSFRKGISPGIILAFGSTLGSVPAGMAAQRYSLGFTVSEYAAYKRYFQWELFLRSDPSFEQFAGRRQGGDTIINGTNYKVQYREGYEKIKVASVEVVPVQLRYNLTSFVSAGVGALVSGEISRNITRYERALIANPNGTGTFTLEGETGKQKKSFTTMRGALFADVQLGKVRTGPALGVRLFQYMNPSYQNIMLYASWKF
ncbi:PKD domain-containing protein [Niastella caeni]|uniref:PKD domain-containing protein n=1 Tax=Niastella caeni TaxID=2569763 RepID=A0A4S8HES6_9BACT|nr:PKD domain-containing protein [Niastella caeni]THU33580.1 PKD domain-containing protein [Niastella caeni]